jgi:hypothetical protein
MTRSELRLLYCKLQVWLRSESLLHMFGTMANDHHNIVGSKGACTIYDVRQH